MPFAFPQFEKSRLDWWNCKEIPPLPQKDLSTKGKTCSRHLSSSRLNCNWKFSAFTFQREKEVNILDLNKKVVSSVGGLNSFMFPRLWSHEVISPADWRWVARAVFCLWTSECLRQLWHMYYKLYTAHWASIFTRHSQVRRQQWEGRELYANVRTKL